MRFISLRLPNVLEWLVVLAILGVLLMLLLPPVTSSREGARSSMCRNNLKTIQLALLQYHERWGRFPPLKPVEGSDEFAVSWRVRILPELGHRDLYDSYKMDEPWDGPTNRRLAKKCPQELRCNSARSTDAAYVALLDSTADWNVGRPSSEQVAGVPSFVILETDHSGIEWMEPRDFQVQSLSFRLNDDAPQAIRTTHFQHARWWWDWSGKFAQALTASGAVVTLREGTSDVQIKNLLLGESTQ